MKDIDHIRTLKDAIDFADAHFGYKRPLNFKYVFHLTDDQLRQAAVDANVVLSRGANRFVVDYLDMKLEFSCVNEDFNLTPRAFFGD